MQAAIFDNIVETVLLTDVFVDLFAYIHFVPFDSLVPMFAVS